LADALSYDDKTVKYSAAIAIANVSPSVDFAEKGLVIENLADALVENLNKESGAKGLWSTDLSGEYAERAVNAVLNLGITRTSVIDLSAAEKSLVKVAEYGKTEKMRILALKALSYIKKTSAQAMIAQVSLNGDNSENIRIGAFNALAESAKLGGNMLDSGVISGIYEVIASPSTSAGLRSAGSGAFGALNLPSREVKNLILDQAKS
jgi:hypothetical protein